MKTAARVGASVVIAIAASTAFVRLFWQPWICNLEEGRIERRIAATFADPAPLARRTECRNNLEAIERCIRADPTIVNRYMLKAALLRMLDRPRDAVEAYRDATRFDRRPEIWFNLGQTQLRAGLVEPAIQNLMTAAVVTPSVIYEIPDPYFSRVMTAMAPTVNALERRQAPPVDPHELRLRLQRDPW